MSFAYSTVLDVHMQLLIMVITGVAGLFGYCVVEWKVATREAEAADRKGRIALSLTVNEFSLCSVKELKVLETLRTRV